MNKRKTLREKFESLTEEQKQTLIDIQKSIPKEWTDNVTSRQDIAPVTKEIMERALLDPEVDEQTKKEFKLVLDSGYFNQKIDVEDDEMANLIDAYVEKEVVKAIIAKKLPKPKKKLSFEKIIKRYNKLYNEYASKKKNN